MRYAHRNRHGGFINPFNFARNALAARGAFAFRNDLRNLGKNIKNKVVDIGSKLKKAAINTKRDIDKARPQSNALNKDLGALSQANLEKRKYAHELPNSEGVLNTEAYTKNKLLEQAARHKGTLTDFIKNNAVGTPQEQEDRFKAMLRGHRNYLDSHKLRLEDIKNNPDKANDPNWHYNEIIRQGIHGQGRKRHFRKGYTKRIRGGAFLTERQRQNQQQEALRWYKDNPNYRDYNRD